MRIFVLVFALAAPPACAADRALMLNEQEQAVLHGLFDRCVRAAGLACANDALYFDNKLQAAPTIVEKKDDPPKEPAKETPHE